MFEPGEVCDVVGTAEPVCAASAEPREDPTMLVECHPHADPDAWLLENPGFVSGGNLRWWRDQFAPDERRNEEQGLGDAYDQLSEEASRIAPGSDGVVFLPAMQGAMAPEWNGAARGVFYGLTLAHTRDHMTRAILEGSAFGLRDILEAMKAAGLGVRRLTIVGGGARPAVAADQGGRHGPPGSGPGERRDHRHRRGDPRRRGLRRARDRGGRAWIRSCRSGRRSTSPIRRCVTPTTRPTNATGMCTSLSNRCSNLEVGSTRLSRSMSPGEDPRSVR